MDELIARLDTWLRTNRPDEYSLLHPGLTEAELDALETRFALPLPSEYRTLYRWKNGLDYTASVPWFTGYQRFCGVEEASVDFEMNNLLLREDENFGAIPGWWNPRWLPFTSNGSGDSYCIDFAGDFGGHPGQIVEFVHDLDWRPIRHASLEKWLETVVMLLECGVMDEMEQEDEYDAVFAEVNPGYPIKNEL